MDFGAHGAARADRQVRAAGIPGRRHVARLPGTRYADRAHCGGEDSDRGRLPGQRRQGALSGRSTHGGEPLPRQRPRHLRFRRRRPAPALHGDGVPARRGSAPRHAQRAHGRSAPQIADCRAGGARALGYVHTQKIIHRDLKPDNIHITAAGVVKLIDFGIAKTEGLQMTRAGYVLGTPFYMAPEQVTGENITEQVDVYAFGVLLFELLTGRKPVDAEAVERIFYSILNEPLKLEPLYEAGVPPSVSNLIARCTAKNPAERPQGFGAVTADLDRAIAELDAPTVVLPATPAVAPTATPAATVAEPPAAPPRPAWLVPGILV